MQQLKTTVEEQLKNQFVALAKAKGMSEAELLRQVVIITCQSSQVQNTKAIVPENGNTATVKMTVRVPAFIKEEIVRRAKNKGYRGASRWVQQLIQSNLLNVPMLNNDELNGLSRSNSQLASIGRNLNQVARHLNEGYETERMKLALIRDLQTDIENTKEWLRRVMRWSRAEWEAEA